MTKAWLLPIYHPPKTAISEDIGAGWPYPPNGRPNWDKRQPAAKAVIKGGQDLNLVFGVTRTSAKTSRSGGPLIVYSAGGNTYTLHENQSIVLTNRC
jgi:hypothetical protein